MELLRIVKVGGNVINDTSTLESFLKDFEAIPGKKIIVHGGGKVASEISAQLGIEPKLIDGRRITDEATMRIVTMVYAGLINKQIVSKLNSIGCQAIGLSGTDALVYPGKKRSIEEIDYGYVADLDANEVNTGLIDELLKRNITPVFAPITSDLNGVLLNINADTVASALASALSVQYKTQLVMCFEKNGVLKDKNKSEIIPEIKTSEITQLIRANIITDGMIPKIENARRAVDSGVSEVIICNSSSIKHLTNNKLRGTSIHV